MNNWLLYGSVVYGGISLFYFSMSYQALSMIEKQLVEEMKEEITGIESWILPATVAIMSILWPLQILLRGVPLFRKKEE